MGVEVTRDKLSPMVRAALDPARETLHAALPEGSGRRLAYAVAMFRLAGTEILSIMPNADGYSVLMTEMQRIADHYRQLGQTLPSTNEH